MTELRLIAGSGRSGTTWLLDSLAEANGLRPVFEPLHPDTSRIAREFAYRYLDRADQCDELKSFFGAAADNTLRSVWTSYRIRPGKLRLSRDALQSLPGTKAILGKWKELARAYLEFRDRERRERSLVKCIRANLMLDWLQAHFSARIVLLIRHPGAVVESQLRFAEYWDPYHLIEKYRNDTKLMSGPLDEFQGILSSRLSRPQALTAIWCIENVVPVKQHAGNRCEIVFYEELLENPEIEWRRVANALGLPAAPAAALREAPSQQAAATWESRSRPAEADYARDYGRWSGRLPAEVNGEIQSMLDAFGVRFYTVTENRPDVHALRQPARPG